MTKYKIASCLLMAVVAGVGGTTGCRESSTYEPTTTTQTVQTKPLGRSPYRPNVGQGWALTQQAFPTGDPETSALLLSTVTPQEVRVGQTYNYQVHVTNLSSVPLSNVVLTSAHLQNQTITASNPQSSRAEGGTGGAGGAGGASWNVGTIPPGETKVVEVTGKADAVGTAGNCLMASYNNMLCTTVNVTQPSLALTKTAPAEVMICDAIPLTYEVRNTGSGTAAGVRVRDTLPAGLTTANGQQTVELDAGDVAPGQTKRVVIQAKAAKTGTYASAAQAMGAGDLKASAAETSTVVRQPVLAITGQAPERVFVGKDITFNYTVKNTGDGPSRQTMVSVPVSGAQFVSATEGGSPSTGGVAWNLGDLAPGASKNVSVTLRPTGISNVTSTATARGQCANPVTATAATNVQGIPAILLEMVDLVDPVQIGDQTTYVITVTNQGSAPGTGIKVTAEIPGEEDFVSQTGATQGTVAGKTVTFAPLPVLNPKAKAQWSIVIKANAPKDVRFKVTLTSDQFSEPIEKTESTNLYR